mmetsp:Transcript_65268/g.105766  ORF Transcript_65268/g.105766 Transcript_65268/m.105766 type:complete len:99 (-) Transcript_65268:650-946(-)
MPAFAVLQRVVATSCCSKDTWHDDLKDLPPALVLSCVLVHSIACLHLLCCSVLQRRVRAARRLRGLAAYALVVGARPQYGYVCSSSAVLCAAVCYSVL